MSTAGRVDSTSKRPLRGLPARRRKTASSRTLGRIRSIAAALLEEAGSLAHEYALSESSAIVQSLDPECGLDFFTEVRNFEKRLIHRALELTGGNQARAARLLGLGTTTLNYKVKSYDLLASGD
jgi:DNA-binding NtrC family response regulator